MLYRRLGALDMMMGASFEAYGADIENMFAHGWCLNVFRPLIPFKSTIEC